MINDFKSEYRDILYDDRAEFECEWEVVRGPGERRPQREELNLNQN